MLRQRIITAAILFVLFLAALFGLPELGWQVLVLVVMWQGGIEWSRLAGLEGRAASLYPVLMVLSLVGVLWLSHYLDTVLQAQLHLVVYLLAAMLWVFLVPTWLIASWRPKERVFMGVVGWLILLPTGLAMADLREQSPWMLLFVMTVVMMADISAYFAGKRFGKNKLAPSISPGKTWEGVFGALAGVTVYIVAIWWLGGMYKQYPALPAVIVTGWWWVGLAVVGDLFESAVKRQAGVKDSGTLLPGHGGLLDRIDALTSTLPFAALWLVLQRLE